MPSLKKSPPDTDCATLTICVDDYGLHGGINRAVLDLAALGRVQATSAMVGAPAWMQGAAALRALPPAQLQVGLHLDLTECPLNPALRHPLGRLIASAYLRQLPAALLRAEVAAQLDAFCQTMGRAPDYIDGHQHVHQLPQVRELLLEEIARRFPGQGLWLRNTQSPERCAHLDARTAFKAQVIAALGSSTLRAQAQCQGLAYNARLLGVYDFTGGAALYRARLQRWLAAARTGDLLICHVGYAGSAGDAPDAIAHAREAEMAVIGGADFANLLNEAKIALQPLYSKRE